MADNGEKKYQKILEGIHYLIGDNKLLREELKESGKRAEEDRRRADEDRRRSDERFERMMERSDERFAFLADQVKRTNRVAVEVARDIRGHLQQANRSLEAILKKLSAGSNGK